MRVGACSPAARTVAKSRHCGQQRGKPSNPFPAWAKGFTLLEVLVVMLLISVVVGITVLSLGDGGRQDRLEREARRLMQLFTLAGDEAILQSYEAGAVLQQQGYRFVRHGGGSWHGMHDAMFRQRRLPDDMVLELYVDGLLVALPLDSDSEPTQSPQILFLSSGDRTPFELVLAYREPPRLAYRLDGPMLGPIRMSRREDG